MNNSTPQSYRVQPFRVLIVDDSEEAREGMKMILEGTSLFDIVGEASNGHELLTQCETSIPDIILMDINMPKLNGLEATRLVKAKFPYIKVVIVTVSDNITHLFEALKQGAQGYLLKNLNPDIWIEYLTAIALDEVPMSQQLATQILKEFTVSSDTHSESSPLTAREKDILQSVTKGYSNREIANELSISEHTVKNHLKNIMQKLHLENRVQLARYGLSSGLQK